MDLLSVIPLLRNELKSNANEITAQKMRYFFKEEILPIGVKSAQVKAIHKIYYSQIRLQITKNQHFELCEEFLKSGFFEESIIACDWIDKIHKQFESNDIEIFDFWLNNYVTNWATCDTLCNHAVANLLMRFPNQIYRLKEWTKSDNRWVKRASAVTLIIPARRGLFLSDIFEIADNLLLDTDDLVQKGYGWMLKAASEAYPNEIFDYVCKNKSIMPRTALRYAIEKMEPEMRVQAMKK